MKVYSTVQNSRQGLFITFLFQSVTISYLNEPAQIFLNYSLNNMSCHFVGVLAPVLLSMTDQT